jgi:hypothetical protein
MLNRNQMDMITFLHEEQAAKTINIDTLFIYGNNLLFKLTYKAGMKNTVECYIYNGCTASGKPERIPLEQFERYQRDYMLRKRRSLTEKDRRHIEKLNKRNDWGISGVAFAHVVKRHKRAFLEEDYHGMAACEERLTDINYHTACKLIAAGHHEEALKML